MATHRTRRPTSINTVGIFGPGFQGATSRGVDVMVPAEVLADAQAVLKA